MKLYFPRPGEPELLSVDQMSTDGMAGNCIVESLVQKYKIESESDFLLRKRGSQAGPSQEEDPSTGARNHTPYSL
jgi:hypothetical protein